MPREVREAKMTNILISFREHLSPAPTTLSTTDQNCVELEFARQLGVLQRPDTEFRALTSKLPGA